MRDALKTIILKKYPDYKDCISSLYKYKTASYYNMFIMDRNMYKEYMEWLFSILFEYEKYLNKNWLEEDFADEPMCSVKQRILWFLSERMINLFAIYQKNKWKKINYEAHTIQFV